MPSGIRPIDVLLERAGVSSLDSTENHFVTLYLGQVQRVIVMAL